MTSREKPLNFFFYIVHTLYDSILASITLVRESTAIHGSILSLNSSSILTLMRKNPDPDPAFHSDADPDLAPASLNDADPDQQHWPKL